MSPDSTKTSNSLANWSRFIGVFSVQVVLVAILMHRFLSLTTPVTINLFLAAMAGAILAILFAVAAFVLIWRDGRPGGWRAFSGLFLALTLLSWPAILVPFYNRLPPINDVTTDTELPPSYVALAARRTAAENRPVYGGARIAELQRSAYPDIRPVIVPRPVGETWEIVRETLKKLRWNVVADSQPQAGGRPGYVEAIDRTLILGFYDDIAIRLDGDGRETRIDIRSSSRFGVHDFGRNATRIRKFFAELKAQVDATVTGGDGPRRRRGRGGSAVPKRAKDGPVAATDQPQKRVRARQGSRREP